LADLDIAVQKMPDNGRAIFAKGRCRLQLGQIADAEADFRQAMVLEPENPEPINALAQLLWRSGRKQEAELLFQQGREKGKAVRTAQPGEIRGSRVRPNQCKSHPDVNRPKLQDPQRRSSNDRRPESC
jgi:tetratricopeptide (TPR) repeat protein